MLPPSVQSPPLSPRAFIDSVRSSELTHDDREAFEVHGTRKARAPARESDFKAGAGFQASSSSRRRFAS